MSKLVPKLRFDGFSGEWEEKELIDICEMQAGKFVQASDIYNNSSGLYPCFGGNGLRGYTKSYTHFGNYPLIGRQGELCGNINFAIGQFHATEHAVVSTPRERINTLWLYYLLINLKLNQYATGQAQPGLSVKVLEKVEVLVPKSEDEQQKIADCLSSLDSLIEVQNKKIEALKAHKKGLMQQLFPSEGKTVPKLRFDGFSGEWEEKEVDDVFDILAGGDVPKEALSDKKTQEYNIPILSNGIAEKSLYGWTNKAKIDKPSLTVSARGTIGWTSLQEKPFFPIVRLIVLTAKIKIDLVYSYYYMKKIENNYKYAKVGIPQLTKPMIKNTKMIIPKDQKEQQKIADCLSYLDSLIEAQNKKVEALKEHKKGLMQQLFVEGNN